LEATTQGTKQGKMRVSVPPKKPSSKNLNLAAAGIGGNASPTKPAGRDRRRSHCDMCATTDRPESNRPERDSSRKSKDKSVKFPGSALPKVSEAGPSSATGTSPTKPAALDRRRSHCDMCATTDRPERESSRKSKGKSVKLPCSDAGPSSAAGSSSERRPLPVVMSEPVEVKLKPTLLARMKSHCDVMHVGSRPESHRGRRSKGTETEPAVLADDAAKGGKNRSSDVKRGEKIFL